MEIVAGLFVLFGVWLLLALPFCLIATGSQSWRSEDPPDHSPLGQLPTQCADNSDRKSSAVQTPETSPKRREFGPEPIVDTDPTVAKITAGNIMELPRDYCFLGQDQLLAQLQASEADKFVAHLYQARRQFRHISERPGKGSKPQERAVLSSYQIAQGLGFNGDFRAWKHLLQIHD